MIDLQNVEKTYFSKNGDVHALKKTNLHINAGEIFGIIGLSGAGKSTLIRCINMLETPTAGKVFVDGQELTAMRNSELRKARQNIGMIFQHFNLLASRTVYDNIAFPLEIQGIDKAVIKQKVEPLLELVGLTDRRDHYPSQLSGGQKQRVGIARALASNPKILLCDEATSALDPQTTKSILELLRDINKRLNLTIVMITHQMQVVKDICDRVAVIEHGSIIEEGSLLDLFTNPQTATTKEFISTINNVELPAILKNTKIFPDYQPNTTPIIRISFIGNSAGDPLISTLIKNYSVDVNIIYGNIDSIKDTPYGTMVVELSGTKDNMETAISYLQERNLKIEVLGYVARND
ncbi:MAG: methionine ABC transporter ATP-binding protein [Acidaminococcaceae bacterium]|nr:methionine ABC transporter ATP-binding protein [Acidaminococcaceae bacterium]